MADYSSPKRPEARYEPGTLDHTRKNIGAISEEEAKKMTKILGGEIFTEKSAPIDYDSLPRSRELARRAVVGKVSTNVTGNKSLSTSSSASGGTGIASKTNNGYILPEIPAKERQLIDKLMMSDDYKIKANYGLFNFVRHLKKNGLEQLRRGFIDYSLPKHVDHMQEFITAVQALIQISPETYKSKILTEQDDRFRFLKTVASWPMKSIRLQLNTLQEKADTATVVDMVPFIKTIYRELIKVYYLGESHIPNYFKEVYTELSKFPKADKKKLSHLAKSAMTEWFYVYSQLIKGLYPILMRICSNQFDYFQDFFLVQTTKILNFLGMTKFDLLLPGKKQDKKAEETAGEKTDVKKEEAAKADAPKTADDKRKAAIVNSGLKLLDKLFPEAGFMHLDTMPDMYPYFQPIYQFRDGYNMLSPENPLQITVTLLRITEDLIQGCRNIAFTSETDDGSTKDKLSSVLSEWTLYREDLFEKIYGDQLRDFVNQEYSTRCDFHNSLYGKKMITTMLWQTKFNFLPHFEFTQILLERPKNDSQYRPLCLRTDFLYRYLLDLSKNIGVAAKTKGTVIGIANPWAKYVFDIPNPISKRLDVLLGAKRNVEETAATNANLIKYTLCIVAVLDWWINDKSSPAYSTDSTHIYRISEDDGAPEFSVPLRTDQNDLFAQSVKNSIGQKKVQAQKPQGEPQSQPQKAEGEYTSAKTAESEA